MQSVDELMIYNVCMFHARSDSKEEISALPFIRKSKVKG